MHSNTKGSQGNITTGSGRRKALFKLSKLLKFSEHTDFSVPLAYDGVLRLLLRRRVERGSKNNVVITAHLSVILAGSVISLLDFRCVTKITPCCLVAWWLLGRVTRHTNKPKRCQFTSRRCSPYLRVLKAKCFDFHQADKVTDYDGRIQ